MSVFRFRKFSVENTESAMKVNTDGVLLGALMTVRASDRMSLDVGTGTGTIALMAAQRLSGLLPDSGITPGSPDDGGNGVRILAIDIDKPSADEAARNFSDSPWPSMLESFHASLEEFRTMRQCTGFDHIFSNPPYYDMSLTAPDPRRNTARHTDSLSYRELVEFASAHLSPDGILSVILPADSLLWLTRYAGMYGLYRYRTVKIRTTARKQPSRAVVEFGMARPADIPPEELLTIHDGNGYSSEYIALTSDFYI